jgi:hypothetical protein
MRNGHKQQPSRLPDKVWTALWREALTAEGRSDAFGFGLECDGDLEQLKGKLQEVEQMMSDPDMLKGPMSPGSGPRIYREGYLVGLKEAIAMVADTANAAIKQSEQVIAYKG